MIILESVLDDLWIDFHSVWSNDSDVDVVLTGMCTALIVAGSQRQVQDKTFFLGMLRFFICVFMFLALIEEKLFSYLLTVIIIMQKSMGSLLRHLDLILCMCRTKVNELSSEIGRFRTEIDTVTQDQSSYVSYEKRYVTLHEHVFIFCFMLYQVCIVFSGNLYH